MKKLWYPKGKYEHERLQSIFRHAEAAVKIEGEKGDIYLPAIPLLLLRGGTKRLSVWNIRRKKRYFLSEVVLGGNGGGEEAIFNKP